MTKASDGGRWGRGGGGWGISGGRGGGCSVVCVIPYILSSTTSFKLIQLSQFCVGSRVDIGFCNPILSWKSRRHRKDNFG